MALAKRKNPQMDQPAFRIVCISQQHPISAHSANRKPYDGQAKYVAYELDAAGPAAQSNMVGCNRECAKNKLHNKLSQCPIITTQTERQIDKTTTANTVRPTNDQITKQHNNTSNNNDNDDDAGEKPAENHKQK